MSVGRGRLVVSLVFRVCSLCLEGICLERKVFQGNMFEGMGSWAVIGVEVMRTKFWETGCKIHAARRVLTIDVYKGDAHPSGSFVVHKRVPIRPNNGADDDQ
jgi:hypothetical protein